MLKTKRPASDELPSSGEPPVAWGAAAVATVGRVTVEVDEALAAPEWQLSLETSVVYLRLGIDGPEVLTRLYEFLMAPATGAAAEFPLGRHGSQDVLVLRDDEPERRFFIVIGSSEKSFFRLSLSDEECRQWAEAIQDVRDQLRG